MNDLLAVVVLVIAFLSVAILPFLFMPHEKATTLLGRKMKPKLTATIFYRDGDVLLTYSNGKSYRGQCTVWHEYPSGKRCSTSREEKLAEEWTRLQWRRR